MAFINGTTNNDSLTGTTNADELYGLAGDDTINPGTGSDTVYLRNNYDNFGVYEDFIDGGVGNDLLTLDYTRDVSSTIDDYYYEGGLDIDGEDFLVAENGESEGFLNIDEFAVSFKNINRFQINYQITGAAVSYDYYYHEGVEIELPHVSGNNTINVSNIGDDYIELLHATGNNTITTDASNDEIELLYASGSNIVTAGAGNDYLDLDYSSGNNTLNAGAGNDYLKLRNATGNNTVNADAGDDDIDLRNATGNNNVNAGTGNDSLDGGFGNDNLNGAAGNDTMNGGTGNDNYVVDAIGDTITEAVGAGIDTVLSPITHTLGNNVENLLLANIAGAINGNGNALSNKLVGNTAVNQLSGGLGNDTLIGNAGNDLLTSGSGIDQFVYDSNKVFVASELGVDTIVDFVNSTDKIVLDKTTFTALTSIAGNGFNLANEFAVVGSDVAASTASALIVYSSETDNLFYNQNGVASGLGSGAQFATLSGISTLSADDFVLQA